MREEGINIGKTEGIDIGQNIGKAAAVDQIMMKMNMELSAACELIGITIEEYQASQK